MPKEEYGGKKIEVLCGMWSWSASDRYVCNSEHEIPVIDLSKYMEEKKTTCGFLKQFVFEQHLVLKIKNVL